MTVKNCPFCGEHAVLLNMDDAWFFECRGFPKHRFKMEGMDSALLPADVLEQALKEWDRRSPEDVIERIARRVNEMRNTISNVKPPSPERTQDLELLAWVSDVISEEVGRPGQEGKE